MNAEAANPPGGPAKPFTLLGAFGRFGAERRVSLRDPSTLAAFTEHVVAEMQGALDDGIPLIRRERRSVAFPLWTFEMQPNPEGLKEKASRPDTQRARPNPGDA